MTAPESPQAQDLVSNCCHAEMKVMGGSHEGATNYYKCLACGEPCDPYASDFPQPHKAPKRTTDLPKASPPGPGDAQGKLDRIMEDLIVGHNFEYARKAILALLSDTLEQVEAEGPKDVDYRSMGVKMTDYDAGGNEANAAWHKHIAATRRRLLG